MKLTGRPFFILLLLWALIVPTGMLYLLSVYPFPSVSWLWLLLTAAFGFLSIHFPIVYNGKSVILFVWFTLPIFLLYGLTAEVVVTQVVVILAVLSKPQTGDVLYRLLYNSLAYFLLSCLSAGAFALTGAEIGGLSFGMLVAGVFAYQIAYSLLYDGIFSLYGRITNRVRQNTLQEKVYHYLRLLLVVPLALSLYYTLSYYGTIGYALIGIPFFLITLLLRLNRNREDLTGAIRAAGTIGRQLAGLTKEDDVIHEYLTKTSKLFAADYIYLYEEYEGWMEPRYFYADGVKQTPPEIRLGSGQGVAGRLLSEKTSELYTRREQWIGGTITQVPPQLESLMCIPLFRHQRVVGGIVLGSRQRAVFKELHLKVLDLLSSYFLVAAEKAKYIEQAEQDSHVCALTGLRNYRYLEEYLEQSVQRLLSEPGRSLSVVMLDIDHFKSVNDTYGHDSGNRVLKQLADLLQSACPERSVVCRYGGEEFVYVLNGYGKDEALAFAETLRQQIERTPMSIETDLAYQRGAKEIAITSSFGVSSAPDDSDEAMGLLRNADRALYIGGKQAGRNRVGNYVK